MWRISYEVRDYQLLENETGMGANFRTVTCAAFLRAEDGGNRFLRNVATKLRGVIKHLTTET